LLQHRFFALRLRRPKMTYVGNVNARAMRTPELIASDLANNIAHGVRWHDATTIARELGCNLFLEMPPGHVLTDLAKENLPGVNALAVEKDILPRVLRLAKEEISAGG
jgi:malonate decarboxylase epsilon subunit